MDVYRKSSVRPCPGRQRILGGVQFVNVENDNYDYLISNRLEPNWILSEEIPVNSWLKSAKALRVLKRPAPDFLRNA